jgi:hypothetical protein
VFIRGFRKILTTKGATYVLVNKTLSAVKTELIVEGNFSYLAKAFDCVNCDIYLCTLNFHGITGKANECVKSYLITV